MNEEIDKNYKTILVYNFDKEYVYELKYNPKTRKTFFIIHKDEKKENIAENNNDFGYELRYDPRLRKYYFIIHNDEDKGVNVNE